MKRFVMSIAFISLAGGLAVLGQACGSLDVSETEQAVTGTPTCVVVAPPTGGDDTSLFTAAITTATSGGTNPRAICVRPGNYKVVYNGASNPTANIKLNNISDLAIYGSGPESVITMVGSASETGHCVTNSGRNVWYLLWITNGSSRIQVRDLTLKAGTINNYNDQTQLIQIGDQGSAAVSDISIDNVSLEDSCGDGLYAIGDSTHPTTDVSFTHSQVRNATRRSVNIKHDVHHLNIVGNYIEARSNAIYDDPSQVASVGSDNVIADNILVGGTESTSPLMVIRGETSDTIKAREVIEHNLLIGGGMFIGNLENVSITGNTVIGPTASSSPPEVDIHSNEIALSIDSNLVLRRAPPTNFAIYARAQHTGAGSAESDYATSSTVAITNNVVLFGAGSGSGTPVSAIRSEDSRHTSIVDNAVYNLAPSAAGISVASQVGLPMESTVITGNRIVGGTAGGAWTNAISVTAGGSVARGLDGVSIRVNSVSHADRGVLLTRGSTNGYLSYPIITANSFSAVTTPVSIAIQCDATCQSTLGLPRLFNGYITSGNGNGPLELRSSTAPDNTSMSAADGSTCYVLTTSGSPASWYVHEGGAWVPK